jgi:hypothetical protein
MEFLKIIIVIVKKDKDENIVIEQTQLIDEIKWFVCLLKLMIFFFHTDMIHHQLE